jgi:hypothetical protein
MREKKFGKERVLLLLSFNDDDDAISTRKNQHKNYHFKSNKQTFNTTR